MKMRTGLFSSTKNYLLADKKALIFLSLLLLFNIAVQTLPPRFLGRFIDAAESGGRAGQALLMILFYFLVILLKIAGNSLAEYRSQKLGLKITDAYRRDVMAHYMEIGIQTHRKWKAGEIITRLDEDTQGLFRYYYVLVCKLGASGCVLLCVLAVLGTQNGLLALTLFAISVLSILGFKWIQEKGIAKYVKRAKANAAFNGSMKELLDNFVELRCLGAKAYGEKTMRVAMRRRFTESFPASLMYGNLWSASTLMQAFVQVSALAIGMFLWDRGIFSAGTVFMIYTYTSLIIDPLQDFRNLMGQLPDARAGMLRIEELMALPDGEPGGSTVIPSAGGVRGVALDIEDLRFSYEEDGEVLRGVNLSLRPGEHVGIMGETGCGKSTLIGLVSGLYGFTKGTIRLNGADIRTLQKEELRRKVAFCPQSVQLLHGSLRDNIALYDERCSDEEIWEAARALHLEEWLAGYPKGLDTVFATGENHVSAGEAQLITLLRVALRNPELVLLDEITSRLDSATEELISFAMRALCEGKTVLAIAHKASAVAWMDRVCVMENGSITIGGEGEGR